MCSLDSEIRTEIMEVLTSSVTGLTGANEEVSSVFEYEVEPGLFLGVAPREDTETIATLYVYIADLSRYTDEETALEDHPSIENVLYSIDTIITETFEDTDVDTSTFPTSLDHITQEETPGRYYAMDLPRGAPTA